VFFKTSFFRWWLATFQFFLLFVVLYFICHFYYICWTNLSKRPAVKPSDFWENRTRFQKQRFFFFFNFGYLRLRVYNFLYFCWFSGPAWCPPGPKWAEKASTNDPLGLFLQLFGTHAANKTHTHTHTTTPQPHNTTCNVVWHRTTDPFGSFLDPCWLFSCFSNLFSSQQPKQTNPQTHKPTDTKNLARRNARSRFESKTS
jgi:hypothetical protein